MDEQVKQSIVALAEEATAQLDDHPSEDQLIAYHGQTMVPAERERIQDHLTYCPTCARLLLDLAEFMSGTFPPEPVSEAEREADWQALEARLPDESSVQTTKQTLRLPVFISVITSIAATVLLFWGLSLQRKLAEIQAPQAMNYQAELLAKENVTRSNPQGQELTIEPHHQQVMLHLVSADLDDYDAYRIEIHAPGAPPQNVTDVLRNRDGSFSVSLHASTMKSGSWHISIYGQQKGQERKLGTYPFQVSVAP